MLKIPAEEIYEFFLQWAKEYKGDIVALLTAHKEEVVKLLSVGREDRNPRKDLIYCKQILEFISYYFDEFFKVEDPYPENMDESEAKMLLRAYLDTYNHGDDQSEWFAKIREIAVANGYAAKPKDFKKNPDQYKGHVGDVSTVVRLAIVGKAISPDVWSIQQIMGENRVMKRLEKAIG
jgi:glutamyl-tRNA synthetase